MRDCAAAARQPACFWGRGEWDWYKAGLASLAAGDGDGCRAACAALRRQQGRRWAALKFRADLAVLPGSGADLDGLAEAAEKEANEPTPESAAWWLRLAAVRLRLGQVDAKALERANVARQGDDARGWLFVALVRLREGRHTEARASLSRAARWLDGEAAKERDWWELLPLRLRRREAEAALAGRGPERARPSHESGPNALPYHRIHASGQVW